MTERVFPNWHDLYGQQPSEQMPWYYAGLDPDLERALAAHDLRGGKLLDIGTGPATQALALAERGFSVTATDLSAHAIERARVISAERGLPIDFVEDDILSTRLTGAFDVVFDRGCYHVFPPQRRAHYASTVARLVKPNGWLFLKCFSEEQPGEIGPYQSSPREIEELFQATFEVKSIERTIYQGTLPQKPKALFCCLRRR